VTPKRHASVAEAREDVMEFLGMAGIRVVAIDQADADTALDAFSRYGKGRGHPAQLNLGDCFAYAVTRNRGVPLLFKGDDFSKTDIAGTDAAE
jgi:ribonuclease VapC